MPIGTIIAVVIAYVAIAVLLLSLNLVSRWRWWVKAAAIIVSALFYVGSYLAVTSLLGWPTQARVPDKFSLVATRVVEPDKFTGAPGSIYLWLELMDEDNVPDGKPRSYLLGYSEELAQTVGKAQDVLNSGEPVEGSIEEVAEALSEQQREGEVAEGPQQSGNGSGYDPMGLNLIFNDMPAVRLPEKGVL